MIKILFTGVGRRIELIQAFREAALVLNEDIKIYGADLSGSAPALAYCDYKRKVVGMNEPNYITNLLEICMADHIDIIIPTIDTDLLVLSENKYKFESIGTRVMISEPDKIHICRDKNITSEFFVKCGLCAPLPVNDWKKYKSEYPAFIKPKDGSSSINAFKVDNEEELEVYANQIEDYVIQPFVSGKEYTIDVFCDWDGKPLSIVPRERIQVRAGEVLKTRIFMDQLMISEAKIICEHFCPCGPLTIQLIRDAKGIDWFIEINPRYGGGAPLSMKAGARSAENVIRLIKGDSLKKYSIADNMIFSRFDQSVCISNNLNKLKGIIFDLDDTLYSEKDYVRSGYKAVSDYLGGGYEEQLWEYFEENKLAIDELLKGLGKESEKEIVLGIYQNHFPNIHLYPGVNEMLARLREKGIKVGIITDGRPKGQHNKIKALRLNVDDIIITDELGGIQFRKPCDIAFRIMQTRWRLNPSEIMYVGDNCNKDFQAPQQLGMNCLMFKNDDGLYRSCYNENVGIRSVNKIDDLENIIGEYCDEYSCDCTSSR